ncbi:MAG: hypothetical protein WD356_06545 [Pseudomonadales bacterium]
MNKALKKFRPMANKATVILLVMVMGSFGLFAESRMTDQDMPAPCSWTVQSPTDIGPLFSLVWFQE